MGEKIEDIIVKKKDLALALASPTGSIFIQAPIPGRALVGIWVPRKKKGKLAPMSSALLYSLLVSSMYRLSATFGYWADRLNGYYVYRWLILGYDTGKSKIGNFYPL
jgi:DNA segregation ATPase FtsK/SpoIIIE-like protein